MMKFALIFLGGGVGSLLRYSISLLVSRMTTSSIPSASASATASTTGDEPHWLSMYPAATLMVNVIGCGLIGVAWGMLGDPKEGDELVRVALIVGVLGGFTTFSAFGWETLELMNNGRFGSALMYVFASVGFGLFAAWGGHGIGLLISK
jgi:fluoride exporter